MAGVYSSREISTPEKGDACAVNKGFHQEKFDGR
jgi:hypothetical protein